MTSKLKVNLINDAGDNNIITSDGSGSVTLGTAFPAKFGQIIYGTYNTATNTSSTSYVDTGLNANITPSATSSKVLFEIVCVPVSETKVAFALPIVSPPGNVKVLVAVTP